MTIEIFVPDIGADEVEVTEILVKVGDTVSVDQSLLSVEGDKASMEVPAAQAGVVQEIRVKAGDKVKTGSLIMVFAGAGSAAAVAPAAASAPPAAPVAATPAATTAPALTESKDVKVPDIGGDAVEVRDRPQGGDQGQQRQPRRDRPREERLNAAVGQAQAAAFAGKQTTAKIHLQGAHMAAHRTLGDGQLLSRLGVGQVAGRRLKGAQGIERGEAAH